LPLLDSVRESDRAARWRGAGFGVGTMQESDGGSREALDLQERMEEIAPLLRTLPKGTHVACIQEGDDLSLYNISKALDLVAGRPATTAIDVAERAKQVQHRDAATPAEDKALIDPDHAATVDLSYPVILLGSRSDMGVGPGRVIDGWHRIYRAAQLGIAELPAFVITPEDKALIRIEAGPTHR
jgi:hypothetical protein